MRIYKTIILFCFLLILSACSDSNTLSEKDANEIQNQDDNMKLLEEDLAWMEEMNTDLHAPYDPHILTYYNHEPIGPAVYYDLREEFDTQRHPFYVSFHGKRYKIELGWTGPDMHTMNYVEMSDSIRDRRAGTFTEPFRPFYDAEGWNFVKNGSDWQITAADVTGDGMLDIIVTARLVDEEELVSNDKIIAIYQYTDAANEPLELTMHLQTSNKSYLIEDKQKFYFSDANEWVTEEWGEEIVVGHWEDGSWYVNTNHYLPFDENLSSAYILTGYTDDYEPVYAKANESTKAANTNRFVPTTEENNTSSTEETISDQQPTVPKKSELSLEGILEDIKESCQYADNPCEPLSTEDINERAGNAAIFYIEKSLIARKKGSYEIAEPYIAEKSPIAEDMKKLVPGDASRGVSLTFEAFEILDVTDKGNNNYDVFLRNTYDITGTKKTGLRTFESILRVVYDAEDDQFYAYELIEENEI